MRKGRVKGLHPAKLKANVYNYLVKVQSERFAEYAKEKIIEIGNAIQQFHSKNHMDRTGNLLDSLCWGVSFNGQLQYSGFYREQKASTNSFLHEWLPGDVKYLIPVEGHQLASEYIQRYGNNGSSNGWKVFFAILAPYWGYWEKGFNMTHGIIPHDRKGQESAAYKQGIRSFYQFAVMTQFYDEIRQDLKPARTRFRVSVAKYDVAKLQKRWDKYAGI